MKYFQIKYNMRDFLQINGSGREQKPNKAGHKQTTGQALKLLLYLNVSDISNNEK